MHEIKALIGSKRTLDSLGSLLRNSRSCELTDDLHIIPLLKPNVADALGDPDFNWPDLEDEDESSRLGETLLPFIRIIEQLHLEGSFALVLTQYWGGTGNQAALCFLDGGLVLGPVAAPDAVNRALQALGVHAQPGMDGWDTVGLVRWRSMDDFDTEEAV